MSGPAIAIRSHGVVSAIGDDRHTFFESLMAGRCAIDCERQPVAAPHSGFDPSALIGDRPLRPFDRTSLLTITAATTALSSQPVEKRDRDLGLVLGSTFSSARTMAEFDRRCLERGPSYVSPMDFANTVINAAAGQTAIWHGLIGLNSALTGGASIGLRAIAFACDVLRSGRARSLLAGGVEELSTETLAALGPGADLVAGAPACPIPFDSRRNGIAPGEGAGLVLLDIGSESATSILGYAIGYDPLRGRDPRSLSTSLASTIEAALADAGCPSHDIGAVCAAADGSPRGDRIEADALRLAFALPRERKIPICAPKAAIGEPFGAGGGFQVATASAIIETQRVPPICGLEASPDLDAAGLSGEGTSSPTSPIDRVLVDSYDDDGCCCALVIGAGGDS